MFGEGDAMPLERLEANPILTPADLTPTRDDLEVVCTMNPAAARVGRETVLVVRVGESPHPVPDAVSTVRFDAATGETRTVRIPRGDPALDASDPRKLRYAGRTLLTSMSHLRVARASDDRSFTFDPAPALFPATKYEAFGCEDPRVTRLDGRYWITYTAVSAHGVAVGLASTADFVRFERHGLVFPPYQKDVCIFPEKVGGRYVCRHRPYRSEFNAACIWTAYSPDLASWGGHEVTLAPRHGTWQSGRVGAGAPPIRTNEGWLEIYHAADDRGRYRLGAMLSDLERPGRVISRGSRPVLEPAADYELTGLYDNVVFSNGLVAGPDGRLTVFYGAADSVCAAAVTTVEEMIAAARS